MRALATIVAVVVSAQAACVISEGDVLSSFGQSDALAADGAVGDGPLVVDGPAKLDANPCISPEERPSPDLGDATICGRILDLETSTPVTSTEPAVRVFDLEELRDNPFDAVPLATVVPDSCGWFATTIDGSLGITAIHTGELSLVPGEHRRAISLVATPPGQTVRANAYVMRVSTDALWSAAAGLIGGSFADFGAVMNIYVDIDGPAQWPFQGSLVAGVEVRVDGASSAAGDYYFSDAEPLQRSQVAVAQTATGVNGAGLVITPTGLKAFSGERDGCAFASNQGLALPTMVQVQEISGSCQ